MSRTLRVIPIGGLGEFGMNLMVYEIDGAMIVVDCGMMFPDAATLGVDVVIPDMTYLFERADRVVALFLTHGHEDHIGASPFLLSRVPVPVYGSPLTLGFLRGKLVELGMQSEVSLNEIAPRQVVEAGPFSVEGIHVTHSIVDALGFAIRTPAGTVIHTGDFKLDATPVSGGGSDLRRIAQYGEEGVLLLVSDSTNATYAGFSRSERIVRGAFDQVMATTPGRVIITTFASHIHRIQQAVSAAERAGRKVFFLGRSIVENVDVAEKLGHLSIPRSARPDGNRPMEEDPERVVVITTGTQGEPGSALSRIAIDEHRSVQLEQGDVVVVSARTIPGNERGVARVIDHLVRRGANVIYDEMPDVHVSGHALAEELKLMISLANPRHFIPMHGNRRQLTRHASLAESVGVRRENIHVVVNGDVVEIDSERGGRVLADHVPSGKVFVDRQFEEVADIVVRDRQHLAEDGFVIVVVAINQREGRLVREPEIITRGFVHVDASTEILQEARQLLSDLVMESAPEELEDPEHLQETMRATLKRYFRKKLNRRPMILPVIWEM